MDSFCKSFVNSCANALDGDHAGLASYPQVGIVNMNSAPHTRQSAREGEKRGGEDTLPTSTTKQFGVPPASFDLLWSRQ